MRRTKLLASVLSVATLLFVTACQPTGSGLPGVGSDPLVNVAVNATVGIQDTIVQVPASVAANVCGVDINVLTEEANTGSTPTCTATSSTTMEQLQPYAQEGQLQPTTEPTTQPTTESTTQPATEPTTQPATEPTATDTAGQQSGPQQEDTGPGESEEAPKKTW